MDELYASGDVRRFALDISDAYKNRRSQIPKQIFKVKKNDVDQITQELKWISDYGTELESR